MPGSLFAQGLCLLIDPELPELHPRSRRAQRPLQQPEVTRHPAAAVPTPGAPEKGKGSEARGSGQNGKRSGSEHARAPGPWRPTCLAEGVMPCCTTMRARVMFSSCMRWQYTLMVLMPTLGSSADRAELVSR